MRRLNYLHSKSWQLSFLKLLLVQHRAACISPFIKSFSQYLIQQKGNHHFSSCLKPALRRHDVLNKPKNVQRFADRNCSEDYVRVQSTDKNYRNCYDLCTVKAIGVFRALARKKLRSICFFLELLVTFSFKRKSKVKNN